MPIITTYVCDKCGKSPEAKDKNNYTMRCSYSDLPLSSKPRILLCDKCDHDFFEFTENVDRLVRLLILQFLLYKKGERK